MLDQCPIIKVSGLIVKDDLVLLIKERLLANKPCQWNLVKGTFEPDLDRSILDTLRRECREEVNMNVSVDGLINLIYYRDKDKVRLQLNFLCS